MILEPKEIKSVTVFIVSLSIFHEVMGPDAMILVFPGGLDGKASAYNAGDPGSIPALGGSPGEGNGNPLQCSCLENPMDGGAWWATVHKVTKSQTQLKQLSLHAHSS